jgi:spoIIIJ-associated protein
MNLNNLKKAKEIIRKFFQKTTFNLKVNISLKEDATILVDLKSDKPQVLIGEQGETLNEFQKILKLILKKQLDEEGELYVDLDINNYKKRKIKNLKELARKAADEVVLMEEKKELSPMNPYERRVVHIELAKRLNVSTESVGRDSNRRIIIKPC